MNDTFWGSMSSGGGAATGAWIIDVGCSCFTLLAGLTLCLLGAEVGGCWEFGGWGVGGY